MEYESGLMRQALLVGTQAVDLRRRCRGKENRFLCDHFVRSALRTGAFVSAASAEIGRNAVAVQLREAVRAAAQMQYWLQLLTRCGRLPRHSCRLLSAHCDELRRLLLDALCGT